MEDRSNWLRRLTGWWQGITPPVETDTAITRDEQQYQQTLVRIMVIATIVLTPFIGLGYLGAYLFVAPQWPTLVLAAGLFSLTPVSWIAFRLLRRGRITQAVRLYLFFVLIAAGLIATLLVESMLLIGMLVATFTALIALFIEPRQVAIRWLAAVIVTYLAALIIRQSFQLPPVELGPIIATAFLYVAPVALFICIALVANSTIDYMRNALRESETMRARAEESFKQARQATALAIEANRLKSEFLSMMSHELRTPLHAIIGFSGIMLGGMGGKLDEDAAHMIERINNNSLHLLDLINNVLDLAKVEAHQFEAVNAPYSPAELIRDQYERMHSLTRDKAFEFQYEIDPDLPSEIVGDKDIVQRIITNLLSNAFKFTETGLVKLKVAVSADKRRWLISISDTGIGIPPEAHEYIFDPFRQVDGSSSRQYGGTGLGLAIVKELLNEIRGTIKVESVVGKGSTFTVEMPLIPSTETDISKAMPR